MQIRLYQSPQHYLVGELPFRVPFTCTLRAYALVVGQFKVLGNFSIVVYHQSNREAHLHKQQLLVPF